LTVLEQGAMERAKKTQRISGKSLSSLLQANLMPCYTDEESEQVFGSVYSVSGP